MTPYLQLIRWDKPTGTWLLLWPCWWGVALAGADLLHSWHLWVLFAVGAFVMRSAGCIINDIWDREIDRQVARTKGRPLASGALSVKQALMVLLLLLLMGAAVLLSLNFFTILLGFFFILPVIVYPLMKRWFPLPQLFLGLTFNAGALLGWTAAMGHLAVAPWWLYLGCIFWTLGYDTIYALQDREDDAKMGVKSSALTFGRYSRAAVMGSYALAVVCWGLAGWSAGLGWVFWLGLAAMAGMLITSLWKLDFSGGNACLNHFRQQAWWGCVLWLAILLA